MDKLDKEIINFLQENGRMRYTKIAEELGVTEGTVRNRAARLREEKVIQIIGMTDPHSMGYEAPAMIGVTVQPAYLEATAEIIATFPEVSYLVLVSGEYDLIIEVFCRNREHLAKFVTDNLQTIHGVQKTQTFMILHTYKMAHGAKPIFEPIDAQ
jgi:Lrp/AsnC family transcriptional regulator for asnA, asnC and gidA